MSEEPDLEVLLFLAIQAQKSGDRAEMHRVCALLDTALTRSPTLRLLAGAARRYGTALDRARERWHCEPVAGAWADTP
jgi:hypothetical protein